MADKLVEQVAEIINRYSMFAPGSQVGVAVSGGADSVALLHILRRLAPELNLRLIVLHMNHGLRGVESDGDEEFVRGLARSFDIPILLKPGPLTAATPEGVPGNLEQQARDLRRMFFAECQGSHGLKAIALGHTRSDQAETVLHRLLRGAGLTGLAAMRFVTASGLVRPLLEVGRSDLRAWLREEGLTWRDDSSNADTRFTRNRLRLETLPTLTRRYNPNLEHTLAGLAQLAQAEEDFWDARTEQLRSELVRPHHLGLQIETTDLNRLHLAVRRRLVRRMLKEIRRDALRGLDAAHIEAVLDICRSPHGHDRTLVPGAEALRSFTTLLLSRSGRLAAEPRGYRLELPPGQTVELPWNTGQICVKQVTREHAFRDNVEGACLAEVERVGLFFAAQPAQPFWVRNWQPGDELHRPGHERPEKVKQLFQEFRVRLWERRHWPVVLSGKSIVWVRGFGASHLVTPPSQADEPHFELVYRPPGKTL